MHGKIDWDFPCSNPILKLCFETINDMHAGKFLLISLILIHMTLSGKNSFFQDGGSSYGKFKALTYRGGVRNFPRGADSSDVGVKIWSSGYYKCQNSPKNSLRVASMLQRGTIAP